MFFPYMEFVVCSLRMLYIFLKSVKPAWFASSLNWKTDEIKAANFMDWLTQVAYRYDEEVLCFFCAGNVGLTGIASVMVREEWWQGRL